AQVAKDGLNSSNIADVKVVGPIRVTATEGPDLATARANAPATELYKKGQITIEAKCLRDTGTPETVGEIYVKTSANGAIFNGSQDDLQGGPAAGDFLNTDTPEDDRQLDTQSADAVGPASYNEGEFTITSADGQTQLIGQTSIGVKEGN